MNGKVTYRQQFTRCGKQRCRKCREGSGHGPYWYAYWSENGRTISKYIGTQLPEHIEIEQEKKGTLTEKTLHQSNIYSTTQGPLLRIYLLGQFRLERLIAGEWHAVDSRTWQRRRARTLLGCLLSSPGRRLGREQVMDALWPELDVDVAANRLNGSVHELRQILEPDIARPANSRMLRLERDILELADRTLIWVDAEEFEDTLKKADTSTDQEKKKQLFEEAAALYQGSYLLEELYSEWATQRRDTLQRAWVGLMLNLAQLQVERDENTSALETLDRLRTTDPGNETALQRLMILLTQLDRRGEALKVYQQHLSMLERDFAGDPLPETIDLYEKLRKGHLPTRTLTTKQAPTLQEEQSEHNLEGHEPALTLTRPLFQMGRHNQSPLIGRERETATLRQILLSIEGTPQKAYTLTQQQTVHTLPLHTPTSSRHIHFLLLKGEPGIGKTRLAEEISLKAYTRGWTIAWSRSYEQESAIPYHPWTELLRTLFQNSSLFTGINTATSTHQHTSIPTMSSALALRLERLSALLPELALRVTPPPKAHSPLSQEQERLHLWEATLAMLSEFSASHPLLLVLDDLHWADESSIELLTYIIHHIHNQRILFVGTCRDAELAPQHKLRVLITDLQREQAISIVPVLPLTQSQIGALVSYLPQDMVASIQDQAAGNPFFAEELARYVDSIAPDNTSSLALHAANDGNGYSGTQEHLLPEAIAAVLERRLSRLSRGCHGLLSKAAVLGGSFELSQLLPMVGEQDEDLVLDLLEEALSAGLLTEEGTGAHITYHFWHPLIINHLYARLSAARRALLHRKAAEAIRTTASTQPKKAAAAIVYHLQRGGGDTKTLAQYAEFMGNQAYSLAAYTEAQQYYLIALQALTNNELYHNLEDTTVQTQIQRVRTKDLSLLSLANPLHFCHILERVAECCSISGKFADARQLYMRLLELRMSETFQLQAYSSTPEIEKQKLTEAQIQALLWREIGNTWIATGSYDEAYSCNARGTEVMSQLGITNGAAWACLLLQYGAMLRLDGNYHEARRYLQEALAMLEKVVPQPYFRDVEETRYSHKSLPPTRIERALKGNPLEIGYAHERLGIVAASLGEVDDALTHMQTALAIYEQSELLSEMARVCGNIGAVYTMKGDLDGARTSMQRGLELAERGEDLPNMSFIMVNLGDVAQRTGNLLEAENWYIRSLAIAKRINDRARISWCSAELATVQKNLGKLEDAAKSIRQAMITGRSIKSPRCIRHALIGLADFRIVQATTQQSINPHYAKSLLLRAKSTLQRAIELAGIEVENLVEGKYLLALVYLLLEEPETALLLTQETLYEAQKHQTTRIIGRAYDLLGRLHSDQGEHGKAGYAFQEALHICKAHNLQLDYARTLYNYGSMLTSTQQGCGIHSAKHGIQFLEEALHIFTKCHATLDQELTEHTFAQVSKTAHI